MFVVREIMHCKPGRVREMVEKFKAVSAIMKRMGLPQFRLMTDVSGERYWTVIAEIEVSGIDAFAKMMEQSSTDDEARKIMEGYHDLVENGRREIYKIES
jgi:hypothetical protein